MVAASPLCVVVSTVCCYSPSSCTLVEIPRSDTYYFFVQPTPPPCSKLFIFAGVVDFYVNIDLLDRVRRCIVLEREFDVLIPEVRSRHLSFFVPLWSLSFLFTSDHFGFSFCFLYFSFSSCCWDFSTYRK